MIPETSPEKLLEAMNRFDHELRDTTEWINWEQKTNHKYAIEHNGQYYPVKRIISIATGAPVSTFSGGDPSNRYVTQKGFSVVQLRNENPKQEIKIEYDTAEAMEALIATITNRGFVFEPWQIAGYVTALRTKPFVILAGVSGTGKSKLPKLVADATGGVAQLLSVRPDWTDSADVLGYLDLQGDYRPGPLLELIRLAAQEPEKHFVCIVDEMNLARVEHYFAEVLSRIEDRVPCPSGGFQSGPLLSQQLAESNAVWAKQVLPPNLAIVGTVNMDESAHGFSRKVLDRSFTIEFSDIDLTLWEASDTTATRSTIWPITSWYPRAVQLGAFNVFSDGERNLINKVIKTLTELNNFLIHAQLQIGYRTRDEIAFFVLHAQEFSSSFVTRSGERVSPLDLALQMKILPRIVGGSNAIRRVVLQLLGFANNGKPFKSEEEVDLVLKMWEGADCPPVIDGARYPRTAARLCLMWDRLVTEGFTSFWL